MVISNITVSRLMRILEKIKSLEGVSSLEQQKYSGGRAELEIKSKYKVMYLAESMENLLVLNLKSQIFQQIRSR